ncbi:MAG: GtrA family protein [Synergistaceae bacterium]|nr:GtrA family protein [Synergistaceae bacterium]
MNYKTIKHLFLYGIVGVLTTVLAIFLYWLFTRKFGVGVVASSAISWLLAVIFAFWANRQYVFHSVGNNIFHEFYLFVMARIGTGLMDLAIMFIFVDVLNFYDMPVKIISNILVIILNYVAAKLVIFKEAQ